VYGMVNKAIEDMVCRHHGETAWEHIKVRANVDAEVFMSNEAYPDEITYRLVSAAGEVLRVPTETILEGFGRHWVMHTAQEGYGGLMKAAGKSLPEFLLNLPKFHARVSMIFPQLKPPRFQCSDLSANSLRLHYLTDRPGLTRFVVGLLQGLGTLFSTPVKVQLVESKVSGADHDVFLIEWTSASQL
jgi:hypothetical protein